MSKETIEANLEKARRDLLELTTRSRLLDAPRHRERSQTIEVEGELSDEVFRVLVTNQRTMVFDPRVEKEEQGELPFKDSEDEATFGIADEQDEGELAARHTDNRLQTGYKDLALQKRLLKMYYDARLYEEELGVGIMYLALGFLKWFDAKDSEKERHAPLIVVPVRLERESAGSRFKLSYAGDEISTNLSLQAKLSTDFGLKLPEIEDADDLQPSTYFAALADAVESMPRWEVLPNDIQLGFFSFTKFLMYRDLDSANWPDAAKLTDHALIGGLLGGGFQGVAPLIGDEEKIDPLIEPRAACHILDADSSQAIAIEEARRGRDLVIQGPPGTGKSQTIANLIAASVADGKKVLFVAEKMAALEVVKRRLDNLQLGEMCLELHSHKARKREVLDELERTLSAGKPTMPGASGDLDALVRAREELNSHAERMHRLLEPAQLTPYRILGECARLATAGVSPPRFKLEDPTLWTRDQYEERRALLEDLLSCIETIGSPRECLWRGVGLGVVLPNDLMRFNEEARDACTALERAQAIAAELAKAMRTNPPRSLMAAAQLVKLEALVCAAPEMDFRCLADPAWNEQRDQLHKLVEAGVTYRDCKAELDQVLCEAAWDTDVAEARSMLAAHGRSWFRFLNGDYRRANALLCGLLVVPAPKPIAKRMALLDRLTSGQRAREALQAGAELGRSALGTLFTGVDSDWDRLAAIVTWEREQSAENTFNILKSVLSHAPNREQLAERGNKLVAALKAAWASMQKLAGSLRLAVEEAFGDADLRRIDFETLANRFRQWGRTDITPAHWVAYRIRRERAVQLGLGQLVKQLQDDSLDLDTASDQFDLAYYDALMRWCLEKIPELAQFRGQSHEQVVERFKALDRERIALARNEVALAHYKSLPRYTAEIGAVGIVRKEIAKKRGHKPLRQLIRLAGPAIQQIKPVFMMSPLSVAQYLEPGAITFDLLLIDEASQVRPVDALGAIARAKQVIVVGDERQLPPTTFFSQFAEDDGDDNEDPDAFAAGDIESILGLCQAQNMPSRMLSWHYRSQHHSLIAVSNREYYDGRLYVIPSPINESTELGVCFHHVADGLFDRGGTASNRIEAERVAAAVLKHAREHPERSLGVGAFSVRQRDEIRYAIERLRRGNPDTEAFFLGHPEEPFFVKNLETVQGDERDVIFISVGYGRDRSGAMMMNFGPLGVQGGERRLNVLITRARQRCEVFSSITDEDIDLTRARGVGPRGLKTYLQYARTGNLDVGIPTGHAFESPFEEAVAAELSRRGFDVEPQVGVAGFFIDIGVRDPDVPGRFLLGIECDGASYHSARWARDRDRLRQTILEDRGWTIHRVWSSDWFQDKDGQLRRLLEAIEHAKVVRNPHCEPKLDPTPILKIVRTDDARAVVREAQVAVPYSEASFGVSLHGEIHEVPPASLVPHLVLIVSVEGPIHGAEIARRLTGLTGRRRTGHRISAAVETALSLALRQGKLYKSGGFYTTDPTAPPKIRDRTHASPSLRKVECLPPSEIRGAIEACVGLHIQIGADEATRWVARALGFSSTSAQLAAVIKEQADELARMGRIQLADGVLRPATMQSEHGTA